MTLLRLACFGLCLCMAEESTNYQAHEAEAPGYFRGRLRGSVACPDACRRSSACRVAGQHELPSQIVLQLPDRSIQSGFSLNGATCVRPVNAGMNAGALRC